MIHILPVNRTGRNEGFFPIGDFQVRYVEVYLALKSLKINPNNLSPRKKKFVETVYKVLENNIPIYLKQENAQEKTANLESITLSNDLVCNYNGTYNDFVSGIFIELKRDTHKEDLEFISEINTKLEELEVNKTYLPMPQNDGFMDMIHNLSNVSSGEETLTKESITLTTKKKNKLSLEVKGSEGEFIPLETLLMNLSDNQKQVLSYIVHLTYQQNNNYKIYLDIDDYFKLRGIERHNKNIQKLCDDLRVLEHMYFEYTATVKGKKTNCKSVCIAVTDVYSARKNIIGIAFGDWVKNLPKNQFTLLSQGFFKYIPNRNKPYSVKLSLKLSEIVRIETPKQINNGVPLDKVKFSLSVKNLVEHCKMNENTIKNKGFVKGCKTILGNALDDIAENEGYKWNYRKNNHGSFKDYKEDFIEFSNEKLSSNYSNIKEK